MFQPWEWKKKIYTAITFLLALELLVFIYFYMVGFSDGFFVCTAFIADAILGCVEGLTWPGEDGRDWSLIVVGAIIGLFIGGVITIIVGYWALEQKRKYFHLVKTEEKKLSARRESCQKKIISMYDFLDKGAQYGLAIKDIRDELDNVKNNLAENGHVHKPKKPLFEIQEKTKKEVFLNLQAEKQRIEEVEKSLVEIERKTEKEFFLARRTYEWLIKLGLIRDSHPITPEILSTVSEIHDKWEKLKNDKSIKQRISGVGDKISELKRIKSQYEEMATRDTSAGKAAKKELEKIEQQLKMKNSELKQLKKLKQEQERSVIELEDQAKLYVLNALAGRVGVTSQEVIDHAEKMIETQKKGLQEIESPIGDFMGYSVIRKEYHGGFADIYRLKKNGKYYALKVPRDADLTGATETLVISEEDIQSFHKEGEIWKSISGMDGVLGLIDYGSNPFPWFIMEFMEGGTLKDRMREGMKPDTAMEYIVKVLETLSKLHEKGIVHRDIKPENILFDSEGNIRITDFGISRIVSSSTSTGAGYKGTLAYSAPEQFDKKSFGGIDHRTDIYQTGAVLYELLTGRPPFAGSTQEIINGIMTRMPERPSSIKPEIGERTDGTVLKALEKRKEDRWQSASEFKKALEGLNV